MLGVHIAHLGVVFQRNAPASSSRLVVGPEEEEGDDKAGKNRENRGGGGGFRLGCRLKNGFGGGR